MIDFNKLFNRVNSLPTLPRTLFYGSIVGLVLLAFWAVSDPASQASTWHFSATPTPNAATAVSPLLFGTNLDLFDDHDQVLTSAPTRKLLQQIHVQTIRVPLRHGLSEATMVEAAQTVKGMGAVPDVVLQGPGDANVLTDDVEAVNAISKVFGNQTVYYEYGDEEDLMGVSAARYTASWNAVIPLLKKQSPQAQFVGPVTYRYDQNYLSTFLKGARPHPDVVSWHEFTCVATDSKETCLNQISSWTAHIANARGAMSSTVGKALPIMISEWNYAPVTANDGKSDDPVFVSTWTQKAFQTLVANHVFASMQYSSTSTVPLVASNNTLAVQGLAFQAMYNSAIKPTPTPVPSGTATALPGASNKPVVTPDDPSSKSNPPSLTFPTSSVTTTSAPQDVYVATQTTRPAYNSSLAKQDNAQWQTGTFGQMGTCSFSNNVYTISISQKDETGLCESDAISLNDFLFQVQMTVSQGDGGGIVFRDDGQGESYRFWVDADGTYDLENQTSVLASGSDGSIKTGTNQSNVLTVLAQGQQITLFVNGQQLASVFEDHHAVAEQ